MKMDLQPLIEERERKREALRTLEKSIEGLQKICEHEFERTGNDSHYDYERCRFCGTERKI
jgi:hypothetical protein